MCTMCRSPKKHLIIAQIKVQQGVQPSGWTRGPQRRRSRWPWRAAVSAVRCAAVIKTGLNMESMPSTSLRLPTTSPVDALLAQLQKIARIGKKMFGVANCIIRIKGVELPAHALAAQGNPLAALEQAFCDSMPFAGEAILAPDTRAIPALSQHQAVIGAPYIRLYAMQPVFDDEHSVAGSLHLIGYQSQPLDDEARLLLADLASLVWRELRLMGLSASQQDLLKKNRSLKRESMIDPLLGTWNRAAITRMLASELERCYNDGKALSLILADLASWQEIQRNYGHTMSDNVLLKFSSRLRSCIRPTDALGRYESETFLVILPGATHKTASVIATRMRQAIISEPEPTGDGPLHFALAMGTVSTDLFPQAALDDLITMADDARLTAKKNGINQIVQARPERAGARQTH